MFLAFLPTRHRSKDAWGCIYVKPQPYRVIVAQNAYDTSRAKWRSVIDARTMRHPGYGASPRVRETIKEVFGWIKANAGLRQTKLRWQATDLPPSPRPVLTLYQPILSLSSATVVATLNMVITPNFGRCIP